jgi:hypothetical protein
LATLVANVIFVATKVANVIFVATKVATPIYNAKAEAYAPKKPIQ